MVGVVSVEAISGGAVLVMSNFRVTCAGLSKLTRASASGLGCFLCEILKFRQ